MTLSIKTVSAVAVIVGTLALAGCASASPSAQAPSPAATTAHRSGARTPMVSGLVAAVSGSTAQVQSASAQTAVSWTAATTVTNLVAGAASDIAVGECVVVRAGQTDAGATPTAVTATSVQLTPAQEGASCAVPAGGSRGAGNNRSGSSANGNGATHGPSAGPRRGGFGVVGTVASVSATGFTVTTSRDDQTSTVTVTTTSSTQIEKSVTATTSAIVTGLCLSATGAKDDTGAITATHISLSQPVNGACLGAGGRAGNGSNG